jgi:hypothetical protein
MSEGVGIVVRRRRSRVEAERLVIEFEQSGLTRQVFCARHGLSLGTLDRYRKHGRPPEHRRLDGPAATSRILPVEFVGSVAPTPSAEMGRGGLWVELRNGRRIVVAHGFDVPTLERLVAVLEQV